MAYNENQLCDGLGTGSWHRNNKYRDNGKNNMLSSWMSNTLLVLGVVMLVLFGLFQMTGNTIDPLCFSNVCFFDRLHRCA